MSLPFLVSTPSSVKETSMVSYRQKAAYQPHRGLTPPYLESEDLVQGIDPQWLCDIH